jgi:hypothetical protein
MKIGISPEPVAWKDHDDVVVLQVPITFSFARGEHPPLRFGTYVDKLAVRAKTFRQFRNALAY